MLNLKCSLENSIMIGEIEYRANFSFDNVLKWIEIRDDETFSDEYKLLEGFRIFCGEVAEFDQNKIAAMIEIQNYLFHSNGDTPEADRLEEQKQVYNNRDRDWLINHAKSFDITDLEDLTKAEIIERLLAPEKEIAEKSFDWDQDAEYIYAAFKEQYNVDLIDEQGKLHWLKFQAMFHSLNKDTYFSQIKNIREMDVPTDPEAATKVLEAKASYQIKKKKGGG
ncbi:Gp15 family bacteriophage protein [Listeria fleischmannii]|uniref:Bacteriophage Gp15 family protein n=1 Tax=Listeria fleischmannii FSL S10-1203 TaxID=1265822 RepID=W7DEP4_9LIST|nr:Gp15 family bacteriophage protein [Listeria fleischmannii]EUJ47648.1 bacteriophage Gp15 family protein [Listeria fleischmannii FSL S10-1203]